MKDIITVNSIDETLTLGEKLGNALKNGDILTLEGDLGAGKTTFTKGIAKGLGIDRIIKSPTFVIAKEYSGNYELVHIDAYRLSDDDDYVNDYVKSNKIVVIEWASIVKESLPNEYLEINIYNKGKNSRLFEFIPHGLQYEKICEDLR